MFGRGHLKERTLVGTVEIIYIKYCVIFFVCFVEKNNFFKDSIITRILIFTQHTLYRLKLTQLQPKC